MRRLAIILSLSLLVGCGSSSSPTAPTSNYSQEEIDRFVELVFDVWNTPSLHKWNKDLLIGVKGVPTETDLRELNRVVAEINQLMSNENIQARIVEAGENVKIHFLPTSQFVWEIRDYGGTAFVYWSRNIDRAVLAVSMDQPQGYRLDVIRHELVHALGFADSLRYRDSTFYNRGDIVNTEFSPLDRTVIRMLYSQNIVSGMSRTAAIAALGG